MKKFDIPPNYMYFTLLLTLVLGFLFPAFSIIGYPLNLLGFALIGAGIVLIYVSWKVFIRNGTSESYRESTTCIVSEGIYAYSRNPMYVGMMILVIGAWMCKGLNLIALVGPGFLFLILNYKFIPYEEKLMIELFGDEYRNYMKKTRRWI